MLAWNILLICNISAVLESFFFWVEHVPCQVSCATKQLSYLRFKPLLKAMTHIQHASVFCSCRCHLAFCLFFFCSLSALRRVIAGRNNRRQGCPSTPCSGATPRVVVQVTSLAVWAPQGLQVQEREREDAFGGVTEGLCRTRRNYIKRWTLIQQDEEKPFWVC